MFDALSHLFGRRAPLFGRRAPFGRRASLSVPILDGALKPNNRLETAAVFVAQDGLEDLALAPDGTLYCAYGATLARVSDTGALEPVATYDAPITALAAMPDGTLAAALGTRIVVGEGTGRRVAVDSADGRPFRAVTALAPRPDGTLLVCDASATNPYESWSRDLLDGQRTGRLVALDPANGTARVLASGLGYAFGALADRSDGPLVSESWRHRVSLVAGGRTRAALAALPGYPARMAPAAGGGFWLTLFACRTQLVEFVLRETDYRREMMRTIDPEHWVAPALSSGEDFLEPLQGGGVKQMGVLKPWAPPRSYGLVIRCTDEGLPVLSLHSRAGGRHHGIVAVAQRGDDLFVLSKGAGRILTLSVAAMSDETRR